MQQRVMYDPGDVIFTLNRQGKLMAWKVDRQGRPVSIDPKFANRPDDDGLEPIQLAPR